MSLFFTYKVSIFHCEYHVDVYVCLVRKSASSLTQKQILLDAL